ncbi:hypothetical protein CMV_009937 [Castanea mollissima]|uniref:DUF4283 domain-containing protein n=1 Tax=Castanea mollissima TaxID=60419 RepID=A0A8J4RDJ2_9ROSI|nr:hypothetical protein CMV_009937 [Castanea mollissima]
MRAAARNCGSDTKVFNDFHLETKREHDLLDVGNQGEEVVEGVENSKWTTIKAVLLLLLGTIIAAAFADPLVDAVDNFSDATSIPAFFISFIALPLATSSSEAVSAIIFASRDKRTTASLTFSELYGSATMNNVLCLSVFLALVYIRGLTWDFSAEVVVILIVCLVMGLLGSLRTHFPLWTAILAILLYPFSLALDSSGENPISNPRRQVSYKDSLIGDIPGAYAQAFRFDRDIEEKEVSNTEVEKLLGGMVEVPLSKETKARIRAPWSKALIVKVHGRTVGFSYLTFNVNTLWSPRAKMDCGDLGKDSFLIKFNNNEDYDKALRVGSWFISEHFLAIKPWEPYFKASEALFTSVAVWVRFPELPIEFYDAMVLKPIG